MPRSTRSGIADWLPAATLLFLGLGGLGAAWITTAPPSGQYLVVTMPGSTLPATINLVRGAHGALSSTGFFANVVVANSVRPDFALALRNAGAWLAVPVPALTGCLDPATEEKSL